LELFENLFGNKIGKPFLTIAGRRFPFGPLAKAA
jgi:hypothetical protein